MRTLELTSPHTKGEDVRRLQAAIDKRLKEHDGAGYVIHADGEYGQETRNAELKAAWLLGLDTAHATRYHVQNAVLHPGVRSLPELRAAKHNQSVERLRQHSGATGILALGRELAAKHIVEAPASSNTGPLIDVMEAECGIHAAPWCGCFAHYLWLHGGGIAVDQAVRYVPSAVAMAHAGTGGFVKFISASDAASAPPGCGVVYIENGVYVHIEVLAKAPASEVETYGGNTGPQSGSGSQADGGGVFHRLRPIDGGGFNVGGFVVPHGL